MLLLEGLKSSILKKIQNKVKRFATSELEKKPQPSKTTSKLKEIKMVTLSNFNNF